ncbi:hypothetical protein T07_10422 [Trichinella nelsoni]|uniref:Uncharacterized protein n=1 Tax=Trichinella nelsoni TaxID=6336 RepID=A0A0V0S929_9BILA|nr:hypothetical protein T07_10422 [Trichinella nelsoni]
MLLLCLPENDNVIEIDHTCFLRQSPQRFLHQTLKRRQNVVEFERHDAELEESQRCGKRRLLSAFRDFDLPVAGRQIERAEPLGPCQRIQRIVYWWDGLSIGTRHGVQSTLVNAEPRGTVFLPNQHYRLGKASRWQLHRLGPSGLDAVLDKARPAYSPRTLRSVYPGTCPIITPVCAGPCIKSHTLWLGHNRAADAGLPGSGWVVLDPHLRAVHPGNFLSLPFDCPNEQVEEVRSQDAGISRVLTTITGTRPLQRPSCNGTTPTPLMHIRRPSASSIVPVSVSKGSPPEAICQRDSGITEATALVSSSKENLVPLSLPFTRGVSSACSPAMDNTRRVPGPPLCVPVGSRWVQHLSWGQLRRSRRLLLFQLQRNLPHLAYQVVDGLGRFGLLRLWVAASELRQGLTVPAAASPYTPASRLFPVPRGHVLIPRLCVQPLPPLGRISRWFSPSVDAGRGTARSDVLSTLPGLTQQVASDHAVVRGRNSAGAESLPASAATQRSPCPGEKPRTGNSRHLGTPMASFLGQAPIVTNRSLEQAHSLPPSCYLRVRRYLVTGQY